MKTLKLRDDGRRTDGRPSLVTRHSSLVATPVVRRLSSVVLLLLLTTLAAPASAFAQERVFHMEQYNAEVSVNSDGSLDVTETLVYVFDQGSFRRGSRDIPLDRTDGITNVSVTEVLNGQEIPYRETGYDPDDSTSGVARTFGTKTEGGSLYVRWIYGPTSNTSRTFRLSYHVNGAVRVYDDRDEVDWYAIPPDWGSTINSSLVVVNLPAGVDAGNLPAEDIASSPPIGASPQGNRIVWTLLNPNEGLEVGVQLPKGVLQAQKPGWQEWQDTKERFQPAIDLALLLVGLLLLVGGVLWSIMTWYRHGRDTPVKLYSDYITDPPSNLPPGLVGTLLDESADVRDVISTVVDQGRKGNLTMREVESGGVLGMFTNKDFEYTQTGEKVDFRFEEMVLNAIFKHGNPVRLSELKNSFYTSLPPIYDEMYRSVVALKYFPESPKAVRNRNIGIGVGFLILAFILGFGAFILADLVSWFLILIPIAIGAIGIVRLATAHIMPRKTNFGAEEATKWKAFSRYLQEMQRYTDVQAAADKFQLYLPYAVALGVERQLIRHFESVPSAMPAWYGPYGYHPYGYYPYPVGTSVGQAGSSGTGGAGPMPSFDPGGAMQGMSDSMAGAMQGMSDSFASMVNSASNIMTSQPSSSGSGSSGGWGGGGGSFGGGGGGGGGGGAD